MEMIALQTFEIPVLKLCKLHKEIDWDFWPYTIECIAIGGSSSANYAWLPCPIPVARLPSSGSETTSDPMRLENTSDPKARVELLRKLRLLLDEADQFIALEE